MYEQIITSQNQALCHLLFHCCMKDGELMDTELNHVSERLVSLGLQKELDVKSEVIQYRQYRPMITDEKAYLEHLVGLIKPVNDLALFSYCIELLLSDARMEFSEETLANNIGEVLHIGETEKNTLIKAAMQRKVVETEKII